MHDARLLRIGRPAPLLRALVVCLAASCGLAGSAGATPFLRQLELNLDGAIFDATDAVPPSVDLSGFDLGLGLGTIRIEIPSGAPGTHAVLAFFDHEIDAAANTFFNEVGSVVGLPEVGQTWEIDEPGFVLGDLHENFVAGQLDGQVGASVYGTTTFPDDVALALGWAFALGAGQSAEIELVVDSTAPAGFHLIHADADTGESLYLSSRLTIVPEPGTGLLVGAGLVGFGGVRRRRRVRRR